MKTSNSKLTSGYPLDGPLPELPDTDLAKSRLKLLTDLAQRENLTIRQLYLAIAGARGHRTILGTPEQFGRSLEFVDICYQKFSFHNELLSSF